MQFDWGTTRLSSSTGRELSSKVKISSGATLMIKVEKSSMYRERAGVHEDAVCARCATLERKDAESGSRSKVWE